MHVRKQNGNRKVISVQMQRILVISLLLVVVDILLSAVVIRDIRRQNSQSLSDMAQLYITEQDHTFFKLSRQLLSILMDSQGTKAQIDHNMTVLEESEDPLEINVARDGLRGSFLEYTWDYGTDYCFFLFLEKSDMFVDLNSLGESVPGMEDAVRGLLEEGALDTYSAKAKWTSLELAEGSYILKVMHHNGRYLGCYIRAERLLWPLQELNFTEQGFCVLVDGDNRPVTGIEDSDREALQKYLEKGKDGFSGGFFVIEKEFDRAPFRVLLFIDSPGMYEKLLAIQAALVLLGAAILGTLIFIMRYVQKRVLRPIQEFTDNLLKYDESDQLVFDITSNELKELEQANEQFRNLLRQIKRLKITLYENELNRQRIQMDYLQLQIRPHFYLNCLNFICQMIDLGRYEDARRMSVVTSDYLRYLFQSSMELTLIRNELIHVERYLEIQKMRYREAFTYYMEQDEDSRECLVPPLMIQTFVENAVRHTVTLDQPVEITVLVWAEEEAAGQFVHISISDTGEGFPEDVLLKLNRDKALEPKDGHRIGITNCIKRMNYFYDGKGRIAFYNNPMGGAVVDIVLPQQDTQEQKAAEQAAPEQTVSG